MKRRQVRSAETWPVLSGALAGRPPERGARTLTALRLARVMTSTCSGAMSQNWWSRSGSPTAATMDAGASAAQRSRKSAPHLHAGARPLCKRRPRAPDGTGRRAGGRCQRGSRAHAPRAQVQAVQAGAGAGGERGRRPASLRSQ
jgi:hypothetical protein